MAGTVPYDLRWCCRKGNVVDFVAYGFYAKKTEDLDKEV